MAIQSVGVSLATAQILIQSPDASLSARGILIVGWALSVDPTGVLKNQIPATPTLVAQEQDVQSILLAMLCASVRLVLSPSRILSQDVDLSAPGIQTVDRALFARTRDA